VNARMFGYLVSAGLERLGFEVSCRAIEFSARFRLRVMTIWAGPSCRYSLCRGAFGFGNVSSNGSDDFIGSIFCPVRSSWTMVLSCFTLR
jgi:hypothetical protein